MNLLPLCTASVWPTNSGSTVERRAHVLTTRFSPDRFIVSIFRDRDSTTYGPFLIERAIDSPLLLPTTHDQCVAQLPLAGLETLRHLAPRRARMTAARGLALAAAHRVIHRVHGHAAHAGI